MLIPTIPSFTANETSVPHLQQLGQAAQFAAVASSYPMWRFYKTATGSLTISTWNTITFAQIAVDTDGIYASGAGNYAQIATQGYYSTEAALTLQGTGSGTNNFQMKFLFTAGANNPNFSSGTAIGYGGAGSAAFNTTADYSLCMADYCPAVCYPGDQISVQVFINVATSTDVLVNTGSIAGWFVPQFSGRWVREGS